LGDIKLDSGIPKWEYIFIKNISSGSAINYPNKYSLITSATQQTRVRARNQVTKNITMNICKEH